MILMVPLMIETFARKLEEVRAAGLPAEPVRKKNIWREASYNLQWRCVPKS